MSLGNLKSEVAPTTFIGSPSGCKLLVRKGTLSMECIPQAVPCHVHYCLALTLLVSAFVLTRGQVGGSQASICYTVGGIPDAQH